MHFSRITFKCSMAIALFFSRGININYWPGEETVGNEVQGACCDNGAVLRSHESHRCSRR